MYIYPTLNSHKKVLLMKEYFEPHFHDYPEVSGQRVKQEIKEQKKTSRPKCSKCDKRLKRKKRNYQCPLCKMVFPARFFEPKVIEKVENEGEEIEFDFEVSDEDTEEIEWD